jgi:CrcB protein
MDDIAQSDKAHPMSDGPRDLGGQRGWLRPRDQGPLSEPEAIAEAEFAHAPEDRPEAIATPWREHFSTVGAISAGGLLGANARYLIGLWASDRWGSIFPWGTLLINVSGCFVIGFYLTLVTERFAGRATTRLLVATGFLGAYTTFSTFSYETARLIQTGEVWRALSYVAASLVFGLVAVGVGIATAHTL